MIEIVPHGPATPAIAQIATLADERRRVLATGSSRQGAAARVDRLQEIDRELDGLWDQRRRELARPVERNRERASPGESDREADVPVADAGPHPSATDGVRSVRRLGLQD